MNKIEILDNGFIQLINVMGNDKDIVNAARTSFEPQIENTELDERDLKLLKYLWDNKHTTPFEMVEFKFLVKTPLFITRQWMRHRTWSYNEQSRRYTSDNIEFYTPNPRWIRTQSKNNKQTSYFQPGECLDEARDLIEYANTNGLETYKLLIDKGVCREQARMVLPQSMYTTFIAKVDLSNLLHFLKLRLDVHAQWEFQLYAKAIVKLITPHVPETMKLFMKGK